LAPRTAVTVSSPLLPTPNASLCNYEEEPETWEPRRAAAAERHGNNGIGMPLPIALKLLPTPTEGDSRNGRNATANGGEGSTGHSGTTLSDVAYEWKAALKLLPTPTSASNGNAADPERANERRQEAKARHGRIFGQTLEEVSASIGATTSPPSGAGKPSTGLRLNPSFVEWMMGAPTCGDCGREWTDPDCPHSVTAFTSMSGGSSARR
jgi:hypothetical protein